MVRPIPTTSYGERNTGNLSSTMHGNPYMHNPKLAHLLPRVTAQSLVVTGKNDRFVDPEYYPAFAKLLPAAELEIVSDAGHFPDIEQLSRTLESIQRFLAKFDR
jgi:pimeloyl-ACP methyl ester carboxylesterase